MSAHPLGRKIQKYRRASPNLARKFERSAVQFVERLGDRQAKARPLMTAGKAGVHLAERFKNFLDILRGNADAGIGNPDKKRGVIVDFDLRGYASVIFGELY